MRDRHRWSGAVLSVALLCAGRVEAQSPPTPKLDSLLIANRYSLTVEAGEVGGPGFDLLMRSMENAQFLLIGEEHNLLELNRMAVPLFDSLQRRLDFQHLVLEQGSVIASWLDEAARVGGRDSVDAIVRAYPLAPTFATDQELALITHVAKRSVAPGPAVWGVDQELSALHLLERLADWTAAPDARAELQRLTEEARPYDEDRQGDVHYLYSVADPDAYRALAEAVGPLGNPEASRAMAALMRTVRIYTGRRQREGWYESGREREYSMRARFMEHYRTAARSAPLPKAMVKMGHWHTYHGFYRGDVPTFGNFLTELAASNGMDALMVATFVVDGPESWRNSAGVIARVADPGGMSVIDLRPLRPLAHVDAIPELGESYRDLIFQADLLLIIPGGRTGTYRVAYGEDSGTG